MIFQCTLCILHKKYSIRSIETQQIIPSHLSLIIKPFSSSKTYLILTPLHLKLSHFNNISYPFVDVSSNYIQILLIISHFFIIFSQYLSVLYVKQDKKRNNHHHDCSFLTLNLLFKSYGILFISCCFHHKA